MIAPAKIEDPSHYRDGLLIFDLNEFASMKEVADKLGSKVNEVKIFQYFPEIFKFILRKVEKT